MMPHRTYERSYSEFHPYVWDHFSGHCRSGGTLAISLSGPANVVTLDGIHSFNGMDPSDPATWVRRYNPQPGMVDRLNFDGAAVQGRQPMGGTWR